eukprot:3660919-Rhodomonas_salina.1
MRVLPGQRAKALFHYHPTSVSYLLLAYVLATTCPVLTYGYWVPPGTCRPSSPQTLAPSSLSP